MTKAQAAALRARKTTLIQQAQTILDTVAARTPVKWEATEREQHGALKAEIDSITELLAHADENDAQASAIVPETQRTTAAGADAASDTTGVTRVEVGPVRRAPGAAVALFTRALAAARGNHGAAARVAERDLMAPDIAAALGRSDAGAGGFWVPPEYAADFIEYFRPRSAVRQLNPTILPMPNGTVTIPKMTGGASATYIGENTNIGKTEQTAGGVVATAKKCAALVPISNSLLRVPSPNVDMLIRDDLAGALAQKSDAAMIRSLGTQYEPKGLRYWAASANILTMTATPDAAKTLKDINALITQLMTSNVRMLRPGFIFAPRTYNYLVSLTHSSTGPRVFPEMDRGLLRGYPFAVTSQIPTNLGSGSDSEIYFADFVDVVIAETTGLLLDASTEAAYHDGSNVVAAFSLDQTVIRALMEHDLVVRHAESVAVLTGVTWA